MADRGRVEKLVGMLGSSFDGERANAAGMLQKMAEADKVSLLELLSRSLGGSGPPQIVYRDRVVEKIVVQEKIVYKDRVIYRDAPREDNSPPTYVAPNEAFDNLAKAFKDFGSQAKPLTRASWIEKAEKAWAHEEDLTDWERDFIRDVLPRLKRGSEPTAKQRESLSCIWRKVATA